MTALTNFGSSTRFFELFPILMIVGCCFVVFVELVNKIDML